MRNKKDGEFVNVKVTRDIAEKLKRYVSMTRLSKTAVVELALEQFLDAKLAAEKRDWQ